MTTGMSGSSALVLFSGGQDSTTCLAWALRRFDHVETVGFDYGQRHAAELAARPRILEALAGPNLGADHVLPLEILKAIGGSALTGDAKIEMGANGLPTTFVPGRNLLFLTAAAALGYRRGIRDLVGGMCETDYSGYPDCRDETLKAMTRALDLGLDTRFTLHTPLMWLDKAATWKLAEDIGGEDLINLILWSTVTCYNGGIATHAWGRGCGICPACQLRARGWRTYIGRTPLDPPWKQFPTYEAGSLGWRMGGGEDYWFRFWDWFLRGLTDEGRVAYMHANPEPSGWKGRYATMLDLLNTDSFT
ncbi:MAG TPA: 7-cyano-7-deazaguanine synthase QueC [Rhizomicrobium sp.]|nr:7-cyano-7-deazaguanine synthase QueC [Rhizomicrobium sp.]